MVARFLGDILFVVENALDRWNGHPRRFRHIRNGDSPARRFLGAWYKILKSLFDIDF
jgi:hypothetical protein